LSKCKLIVVMWCRDRAYEAIAPSPKFLAVEKLSENLLLCISGKSRMFFCERIVNVWNSLPKNVDFSTLTSFRHSIQIVDFSKFLKCYS